jgi:hypothetical protein
MAMAKHTSNSRSKPGGRGWYFAHKHGAGPKVTDRTAPRLRRMKERAHFRHRLVNEMLRLEREATVS